MTVDNLVVNIAAQLEGLADGGGICIAGNVYEQVRNKLPLHYEDLGAQRVKNIAEPVRIWRIQIQESSGHQSLSPQSKGEKPKLRRVRPAYRLVLAGLLFIAGTAVAVRYLPFLSPSP